MANLTAFIVKATGCRRPALPGRGIRVSARTPSRANALERQSARVPGLKVQYPDPAGCNGDASHGLSPQRADPRRTLLRPEIPGCCTLVLRAHVLEYLHARSSADEQDLVRPLIAV